MKRFAFAIIAALFAVFSIFVAADASGSGMPEIPWLTAWNGAPTTLLTAEPLALMEIGSESGGTMIFRVEAGETFGFYVGDRPALHIEYGGSNGPTVTVHGDLVARSLTLVDASGVPLPPVPACCPSP